LPSKSSPYSGFFCSSWLDLKPGVYKIYVEPSGEKSKSNEVYFTITSSTQSLITVLSPNGGEILEIGKNYEIKFKASNFPDDAFIDLYLCHRYSDGGAYCVADIVKNYPPTQNPYLWTIPSIINPANDYQIEAQLYSPKLGGFLTLDFSDASFSIVAAANPSMTSVFPGWGKSGDIITIYGKNLVNISKIEFLKNGVVKGSQSSGISSSPDGSYLKFTLSGLFTENSETGIYQIRVVNNYGVSNALNFTILGTLDSDKSIPFKQLP
jgi:hypothetical protein